MRPITTVDWVHQVDNSARETEIKMKILEKDDMVECIKLGRQIHIAIR